MSVRCASSRENRLRPHLWPSTGSDYVDTVRVRAHESSDFRLKSTENQPKVLILQDFYGSGPRGRVFESPHSDHKKHLQIASAFFVSAEQMKNLRKNKESKPDHSRPFRFYIRFWQAVKGKCCFPARRFAPRAAGICGKVLSWRTGGTGDSVGKNICQDEPIPDIYISRNGKTIRWCSWLGSFMIF